MSRSRGNVLSDIVSQFQTLDTGNSGLIRIDVLSRVLAAIGIGDDEFQAVLRATQIQVQGNQVKYEEFLSTLFNSDGVKSDGETAAGNQRRPSSFSMCAASLKLDGMVMSDAAVAFTARHLSEPKADIIAWLETDTQIDSRASWRRLAHLLHEAGYKCFTDGGVTGTDGLPTPAVDMALQDVEASGDGESKGPRYTALLLCVRLDLDTCCTASPEIHTRCRIGGGSAKGVLQRTLQFEDVVFCVFGASFSPKDKKKEQQVGEIKRVCSDLSKDLIDPGSVSPKACLVQRYWRGHRDRVAVEEIRAALQVQQGSVIPRYTFVYLGDQNTRMLAREGWVIEDPEVKTKKGGPAHKLTQEAVQELVSLLVSPAGRLELLNLAVHGGGGTGMLADSFYDKTQWWIDGNGVVQLPSYKRTPYFQSFPALGNNLQHEVLTTAELQERAKMHAHTTGDSSLVESMEMLAKAEAQSFFGADPLLVKQHFFSMRDKVPKCKVKSDCAQIYLNEDADGSPVYLQMGWLDTVGFARRSGKYSNFRNQRFRHFETVPQVHAFDHLMTLGVMDFEP